MASASDFSIGAGICGKNSKDCFRCTPAVRYCDVGFRLVAVTGFRSANVCCYRYQSLSIPQAGKPLRPAERTFNGAATANGRYCGPRSGDADPRRK